MKNNDKDMKSNNNKKGKNGKNQIFKLKGSVDGNARIFAKLTSYDKYEILKKFIDEGIIIKDKKNNNFNIQKNEEIRFIIDKNSHKITDKILFKNCNFDREVELKQINDLNFGTKNIGFKAEAFECYDALNQKSKGYCTNNLFRINEKGIKQINLGYKPEEGEGLNKLKKEKNLFNLFRVTNSAQGLILQQVTRIDDKRPVCSQVSYYIKDYEEVKISPQQALDFFKDNDIQVFINKGNTNNDRFLQQLTALLLLYGNVEAAFKDIKKKNLLSFGAKEEEEH